MDDAKRGMENALRAKLENVREQYKRQFKACKKPTERRCWNCAPKNAVPAR